MKNTRWTSSPGNELASSDADKKTEASPYYDPDRFASATQLAPSTKLPVEDICNDGSAKQCSQNPLSKKSSVDLETNRDSRPSDGLLSVGRTTKSLLNKLTIEKFPLIAEKLACILDNIKSEEELKLFITLVIDKAIREPDFAETHADLCQLLKWRASIVTAHNKNSSKGNFTRCLIDQIQNIYVNLSNYPSASEGNGMPEDVTAITAKKRQEMLSVMKLIGELFQRKMISLKIIREMVFDLVVTKSTPNEDAIECFANLVITTGYFIEQNPKIRPMLNAWFGRLKELQTMSHYSTRIKCLIQDIIDLREAGWRKKIYRDPARSLSNIRITLENEEVIGGSTHAAQFGKVVVVGERSNLSANSEYLDYIKNQEQAYHENSKL